MKQAVHQQTVDFPGKWTGGLLRLMDCHGYGNDDIAENMRLDAGKHTRSHREGKDIRRSVLPPISPVEGTHGVIADEENAQLGLRKSETREQYSEL